MPHVTHYFRDPHRYFRKRLLIVGGRNSAAEAALRCHHAGAEVSISYRREGFAQTSIKYWLLPELTALAETGRIQAYFNTTVDRIDSATVTLRKAAAGGSRRNDHPPL